MTHWLIIRTDHGKEAYVARQIETRLECAAWVPVEKRLARICRHSKKRVPIEHPVLPRTLFAAVPVAREADLMRIRHLSGVEHDVALVPLVVPDSQIAVFRAEIERLNAATLAQAAMSVKKEKAKWRALKDALADVIRQAKEQLEAAA
jgi:hypothetical protein